jgi:HAD superfamily hydrolase (TIGR01509 family)
LETGSLFATGRHAVGDRKNRGVVVIDFMGVLFREGLVLTNLLVPMFRPPLPLAEIRKRYRKLVTGEIPAEAFWMGMVPDHQKAQEAYLERFELNDGVEVLTELKKQYTLAVLSEIPAEWGDHLVKKFRLDRIFDTIVLSGAVGVTKPDLRIFEILIERLGKDRPYYFIDDNPTNLRAASTFGWKTIWMRNRVFKPRRPGLRADAIIEKLRDLEKLLLKSPPPQFRI